MFSERDLMKRVVLARRDPSRVRVVDVMTPRVVCARHICPSFGGVASTESLRWATWSGGPFASGSTRSSS
jgi:hypothetical protein